MEKEILDSKKSTLEQTPRAIRKHIVIAGNTNSGKSTLLNALCDQEVALISNIKGTTTDPVYKNIELRGVGAVTLVDTAGFGDDTKLGEKRLMATREALKKADVILLVLEDNLEESSKLYFELSEYETPIIPVYNLREIAEYEKIEQNKSSKLEKFSEVSTFSFDNEIKKFKSAIFADDIIAVNAKTGAGIDALLQKLSVLLKEEEVFITRNLVKRGDSVLLVMPQDIQAPKGRLILPQVQTIRELLDRGCIVSCVTTDSFRDALNNIKNVDLVITDSQAFKIVDEILPKEVRLTSFSVLFAGYKGDIGAFIEGAKAIDSLNKNSRVLIAEACAHAPSEEDIGRVKIPALLKKKYGDMHIDFVRGVDFVDEDSNYDLIIHCGGCMFNSKYMMNRLKLTDKLNIPMTNYGITIAKLAGILDRVVY
ncbi:MAG: 50S ribosome-binding GTPase [Eubacteriales bacterium]|nr:50S ribosome-binding GTPase [Eubacteriales bacterium]MDY3332426.1 GTPase [Gallibacter sp.]